MLGINNKQAMASDYQELYWKPRPTVDCTTRGGEEVDGDDDDDDSNNNNDNNTAPEGGIVLDTKCSLPS
jgi:hypothetical protein